MTRSLTTPLPNTYPGELTADQFSSHMRGQDHKDGMSILADSLAAGMNPAVPWMDPVFQQVLVGRLRVATELAHQNEKAARQIQTLKEIFQ